MKGSRHPGSPELDVAGFRKYLEGHDEICFGRDRPKAKEVERGRPTTRDLDAVGRIDRTEAKRHRWPPAWSGTSETGEEPVP
jgi:hypothetical protein